MFGDQIAQTLTGSLNTKQVPVNHKSHAKKLMLSEGKEDDVSTWKGGGREWQPKVLWAVLISGTRFPPPLPELITSLLQFLPYIYQTSKQDMQGAVLVALLSLVCPCCHLVSVVCPDWTQLMRPAVCLNTRTTYLVWPCASKWRLFC